MLECDSCFNIRLYTNASRAMMIMHGTAKPDTDIKMDFLFPDKLDYVIGSHRFGN